MDRSLRVALAYVGVVAGGLWLRFAVDEVTRGADPASGSATALVSAFGVGLGPLAIATTLLLPAMVLTIEVAGRGRARSVRARAAAGAASWLAWGVFLAVVGSVVSRVVLRTDLLIAHLGLIAGGGAVFAAVALGGRQDGASRVLVLGGLGVAALVVLGAVIMSGRWGSTA